MVATVGGGGKKILYTLNTIRKIGVARSAKALAARNTCKACGLGMGGQQGGMTNELGEFPSVCNKSVQAQSTDIQPPIPEAIFDFTLDDFGDLSAREIEQLGRLGNPIFKAKTDRQFKPVSWDWAISKAAKHFAEADPDRTFFYSSGRSSNEAGFALQLMARIYGTNNVNNCSYYCHQATGVGLSNTIGSGTSTVELADLGRADCIIVVGANPASNHPRFIHQLKACRDRGGEVIAINPAREPGLVKFALPKSARSLIAGGSDIASLYIQPHIGSDVAFFKGVAKVIIEQSLQNNDFIEAYTTGFDEYLADINSTSWTDIESRTGLDRQAISAFAVRYGASSSTVFAWGMGITHHRNGVENVENLSNLALLRGMIGRPGCGLLPLRGHSNVQGIGTIGVKPVLAEDVYHRMEQELDVRMVSRDKPGMDTLSCLREAHDNGIDAALVMGGNLLQATPDSQWAGRALSRIPFKVFLTTTLNKGHIDSLLDREGLEDSEALILPVAARDEEPEASTQESMFNFVRLSDGGPTRIAEARPELDIIASLANAIFAARGDEQAFDFSKLQSRQSLRQTIARVIPGMEELADIDVAKTEFHIKNRLMHKPRFNTPTGRANFVTTSLPPVITCAEFPFRAMSVRSEGQFNSIIYEEQDSYRGAKHRQVVMMARADMNELGIKQGEKVCVRSRYGSMAALEVLCFDLPKGDVMLYYPEANQLIGLDTDPRSHTPAFKSVAVGIAIHE